MKKTNKKYIFLIALLIFSLVLSFIGNVVITDRKLTPPEMLIKDSVLFVVKIVSTPFNYIKDKASEAKEKDNIYKKYETIKQEAEKIEMVNAKNRELSKELDEMKTLLELNNTLAEESYLNATVINRNIGYFYNTLTIDKGKNSGIDVNMAVVTNKGLIGKITKVSGTTSVVKLLTANDSNNKISVKITVDDKDVYGLLSSYDEKNNVYLVEGISENIEIKEQSLVTTTGFSQYFPSGVYIGKVKGVTKDNFDLAQLVEVKSDVDFASINFVTVLKREAKKDE